MICGHLSQYYSKGLRNSVAMRRWVRVYIKTEAECWRDSLLRCRLGVSKMVTGQKVPTKFPDQNPDRQDAVIVRQEAGLPSLAGWQEPGYYGMTPRPIKLS